MLVQYRFLLRNGVRAVSSIRSLATITVLAGVGIFLYMKINETDPILPAEVADFEIGEITFDSQASPSNELPQFVSTPDKSIAPAFNPPAPAASAPAWNDSPVANAPPAIAAPTEHLHNDEPADAARMNDRAPDLPTIPSAATTAEESLEHSPASSPQVEAAHSQPSAAHIDSTAESSLFSATRLAVDSALDRGELSQALLLLSDWYDDPSLSAKESQEVNDLLRQLAGTVIYSSEHRLEPPYMVQAGEQLEQIAQKYQVPWQLLAKINGITTADQLQPGQHLKVIRGPFSALIDLGRHKLTLMLDRRYAGQFSLEIDPGNSVEAGHWTVNQKLLTPGNVGFGSSGVATEEPSLMLSNPDSGNNRLAILRGSNAVAPTEPSGRVLRLSSQEVGDVYDILSLGSRVVIRR